MKIHKENLILALHVAILEWNSRGLEETAQCKGWQEVLDALKRGESVYIEGGI